MTILLTGATGFLGSYLLKSFITKGYQVIALKRSSSNTYRIDDFLDQSVVYDIDHISLDIIFEKHKIDMVINTVTDYGRANKTLSSIVNTNLIFGLSLLEKSVNENVRAFINTDTLLDRNINSYALSKAQLLDWMQFLSKKNTKMINIKIEHMYGVLDDENKFIYWLIKQLKLNVDTIDLTSGIQKRDFIYVDDIVHAYQTIINNIDSLIDYEEFELGTGKSIKVKSFIELLYNELLEIESINSILNFGAIPYRENENMNMIANISKLEKLGWQANVSIANGIRKIISGEKK